MGKHVVVGAGAVGSGLATTLAALGHNVSVITRSGSGPNIDGVERIAGDAGDAEALTKLTRNADALYNCANPAYHKWESEWPPLASAMLDAATRSEAVLVTMSNLYGYAAPTRPMKASDPLNPPSRKGAVRVAMWNEALAAHEAGRVRVTEARASDFIGPDLGDSAQLGDRVVPKVLAGKSVSLIGDPTTDHSWTAINDVATTLATLGTDERAWGRPWHVPTEPPMPAASVVAALASHAGVEPVKVKALPKIVLRFAGIFSPVIRELAEVGYQFERTFVIDSDATTDTFGLKATPFDDTLRSTLASYRR